MRGIFLTCAALGLVVLFSSGCDNKSLSTPSKTSEAPKDTPRGPNEEEGAKDTGKK